MANVKDQLIELLLEILKEERIRWRKVSEENVMLVKDVRKRLDQIETDLLLQRQIHMRKRFSRIECDGKDIIDGGTSGIDGYKLSDSAVANTKMMSSSCTARWCLFPSLIIH